VQQAGRVAWACLFVTLCLLKTDEAQAKVRRAWTLMFAVVVALWPHFWRKRFGIAPQNPGVYWNIHAKPVVRAGGTCCAEFHSVRSCAGDEETRRLHSCKWRRAG